MRLSSAASPAPAARASERGEQLGLVVGGQAGQQAAHLVRVRVRIRVRVGSGFGFGFGFRFRFRFGLELGLGLGFVADVGRGELARVQDLALELVHPLVRLGLGLG